MRAVLARERRRPASAVALAGRLAGRSYRQPSSQRIGHGTSLRHTYRRSLRPDTGR